MTISWNTVIFTFRLIFAIDERRSMSGLAFHVVFWGSPIDLHTTVCNSMESPLIRVNKRNTAQWDSAKHDMKGHSRHNSSLIGRKNQAKFENDCVFKKGHRIKITQPNSMILVSFSSVEDALFSDVKKRDTFSSQGTENPPFRFFGTPGIGSL